MQLGFPQISLHLSGLTDLKPAAFLEPRSKQGTTVRQYARIAILRTWVAWGPRGAQYSH